MLSHPPEVGISDKMATCDDFTESEASESFPLYSPQDRCNMGEGSPNDGWTPSTSSSSFKLGTSQYWANALPTPRPSSPTPSTASPTSSVLAPGSLCLGSMTSLLPGPNSELFLTPCPPMLVSGGSAGFYHVRYKPQFTGEGLRMDYFVGKDLSRAPHEVEFYAHLSRERDLDPAWDLFSEVCMYSGGVLSLPCALNSRTQTTKTLLLLENMNSGFSRLRLCDIKIGQETAKAGWKGKSRVGALGNRMVDGVTNSVAEGLRLEGMDRPPSALQRRLDEHVDVSARSSWWKRICVSAVGGERAQRFSSQRLQMREVLQYWLDLSDQGLGYERAVHENVWAILPKVTNLLRALVRIPWPQMWIGSSIGLGLEARMMPGPKRVIAKFFDWGRSDLVNEERYMKLTEEEREEYIKSWHVFVSSCCRLHWELSRVALHRCCTREWKGVVVEVLGESTAFLGAVVAGSTGIANKNSSLFAIAKLDIEHVQSYSGKVIGHQLFGPGTGLASPIGCVDIRIDFLQEEDKTSPLTTRVEVGKAKLQFPDLSHAVVLVQVIAFEDPDDANKHFKSRVSGGEAPLPKQKAASQLMPPGKKVRDGMTWSNAVEFTELGSHVQDAEERLRSDLSEAFVEPEAVERRSSWMELLEPSHVKSTNAKALAQEWGSKFVWWLKAGERYPDHWLAARPYEENEAVEVFSPSAQVWLAGTVVEADLIAVEYSDDEGNPTPVFLRKSDPNLRPKFAQRDENDANTYEVFDDVEVYVPALGGWFEGSVLGVNFVTVVFIDQEDRRHRKQLPSKNALLRRPPPAKSRLEALLEDNADAECEDVETFIESDNDDNV